LEEGELRLVTADAERKSHVELRRRSSGVPAASGALWGILIGLLFFIQRNASRETYIL
jgi:uncharacterized membrane protein